MARGSPNKYIALRAIMRETIHNLQLAYPSPSNPPKYLDTSFITQPMWDYTADFSHSSVVVSNARALFIAATSVNVF
jgi:hypothetical protein